MKFGDRLKLLREEKDITQKQLGDFIGISDRVIGYYENNNRFPKDEIILKKISEYFSVSIDWLIGTSEIREPAHKFLKQTETIALHRNDGYDDALPDEAKKEIESFKEFIRNKYSKK